MCESEIKIVNLQQEAFRGVKRRNSWNLLLWDQAHLQNKMKTYSVHEFHVYFTYPGSNSFQTSSPTRSFKKQINETFAFVEIVLINWKIVLINYYL